MRVLPLTFTILTICGCWPPISWRYNCKRFIYKIHTCFVLLTLHFLSFTQLMDIVLNVRNVQDFADNFYVLLAMAISCCKMISLLRNQESIGNLVDSLAEEPFKTVDDEEIEIHSRFEKTIRTRTLYYAILVESTVVCQALTSFYMHYNEKTLGFRVWLPFSYSSKLLFPMVFSHQWFSWMMASVLHVASDATICGLLIETCCQLEILEYRLKKITETRSEELGKCVRHHDRIYQFAYTINETFRVMIFIQFMVSTLVVCFILCQLVKIRTVSTNLLQLMFYMSSMLAQIFLYCWCGNEVKLKSLRISNKIYELEWTSLRKDAKGILIMIMRRATVPIEFTSACVISMNLESFVNLLKTSYSAYNLLQQTQQA